MRTLLTLLALSFVGVTAADEPVRFPLPDGPRDGYPARIDRADARTGVIEATIVAPDGERGEPALLTEGRYLGIGLQAPRTIVGAVLFRMEVTEVLADGRFRARIDPRAVERFETVNVVAVFRPPGSTTAQMKAAPAVATVIDKETEIAGMTATQAAALETSRNNLKQIAIAFHNYHDTHNRFPPRVLIGPDDKPWHSWRVLLLPFLEQQALYDRYRFDEPWDGPNNRKLVAEMPAVLHDPVHGEPTKDGYVSYAAAAGTTTALADVRFNGTKADLHTGRSTAFRDVIDGTSNTILVGSVSPKAKIAWTSPEDVTYDEDFPGIGKDDGFAAPYAAEAGRAGVFARCDGSVLTITTEVDDDLLERLLVRNDGRVVGNPASLDPRSPGFPTKPVLEIHETEDGPVAHLRRVRDASRGRRGGRDGSAAPATRDEPDTAAEDEGSSEDAGE